MKAPNLGVPLVRMEEMGQFSEEKEEEEEGE